MIADPNVDSSTIEELADSFSFNEIQKRTLHTILCSVLCEIVSDKDALLSSGGLILSFGGMTLFLTFSRPHITPSTPLAQRRYDSSYAVIRLFFTEGVYFLP